MTTPKRKKPATSPLHAGADTAVIATLLLDVARLGLVLACVALIAYAVTSAVAWLRSLD